MRTVKSQKTDPKVERIVHAVEAVDLKNKSAWNNLIVLSSDTQIDGIEVDPAGVILHENGRFDGVANIYVILRYQDDGNGHAFETTDSFLGRFRGNFAGNGKPLVEDITVDTSPFFAGEEAAE